MGRYANFQTEEGNVEYKFWFGVQNSGDITEFGGKFTVRFEVEQWEEELDEEDEDYEKQCADLEIVKAWLGRRGYDAVAVDDVPDSVKETVWWERTQNEMVWEPEEAEAVLEKLKGFGFDLPEWDAYEATEEGWETLYEALVAGKETENNEALAKFCLGCLIFLLLSNAEDTLYASFEF